MNHFEKNAIALNNEQRRQMALMDTQDERIKRLEGEVISLKGELLSLKTLTMTLIGRGATDAHR